MPAPYKPINQHSVANQNKARRQCRENEQNATPSGSEQYSSDSEHGDLSSELDVGDREIQRGREEVLDGDEAVVSVHAMSCHDTDDDSLDINMRTEEGSETESDYEVNPVNDCETDTISDYAEDYDDDESDNENVGFDPAEQIPDEPLYDGAPITVAESLIAILELSLRHKITGVLLVDILKLIALHCPPENQCITTLYKFNKYFAKMQTRLVKHFYCTNCCTALEQQNAVCPECIEETKASYFIEGPVIDQIETLFKRPGFLDKLQNPVTRDRQNPDNYEDIYDGAVYKDSMQLERFRANDRQWITFTLYADGIRIFNSSRYAIWVLYIVINELSYNERSKKENVIFAGLWFGEEKPAPNLFLQPLKVSLQALAEGIEVQVPNTEIPLIVQGISISATFDLPAKALFYNMKQYNGICGCQKCLQAGESVPGTRVRIYPYEQVILRIDEGTRRHAQEAFVSEMAVCGVKGPTIMSQIMHQYMRSIAVDVMHCVFEGVVKALLFFWFSPTFSDHPSSMMERVQLVDERLCSLTPPSSVQRLPRSIEKHLSFWKAHEFKSWLFYWSIPCLSGIMDGEYFRHYLLLVLAISLLCKSSISPEEVIIASRALNEFVSMFENLYQRRYMSNNVHQLLHLAENVRQFGPLWTTSCFPFEDLNGRLKSLVHGSNSAHLQIYSAISKFLIVTTLKSKKLIPGRPAYEFCENLDYKRGRINRHPVNESMYIVGTCKELLHLPDDINRALRRSDIVGNRYFQYQRLLKRKTIFTSTQYRRAKRTNSTFALYGIPGVSDRIGKIKCFVRVTNCDCRRMCYCEAENYAILNPCVLENQFSTCVDGAELSTVHTLLTLECEPVSVNIANLKAVCYYCRIQDTAETFLIEPVNMLEVE